MYVSPLKETSFVLSVNEFDKSASSCTQEMNRTAIILVGKSLGKWLIPLFRLEGADFAYSMN